MDFKKNEKNDTELTAIRALCFFLAVIFIFTAGYISGARTKVDVILDVGTSEQAVQTGTATAAPVAPTTVPSTALPPVTEQSTTLPPATSAPIPESTTSAPADAPASGNSAPASKEDIVALYNEAANKVKTEATKVTRNFKNTRYDSSRSVLPSSLESMANPMMEKYIKDDVEPVDYLTKEEIKENFPAPKQEYSSVLTAADVEQAVCNDNGSEYEITLNLASSFNPTAGAGVGAACHIMDVNSIKSNPAASSMLKKFDAIYEGCVIRCRIDKATNRLTWANFYTPLTIDALVNVVLSEVATTVVMSYERDYTVTY